MRKHSIILWALMLILASCSNDIKQDEAEWRSIQVSENGRFFQYENGNPFFWLGDTGWLIFKKLNREEAKQYLEDRKAKGYNVIQAMLLHQLKVADWQGNLAVLDESAGKPNVIEGNSLENGTYDYWDHVEYIVDLAAELDLYMGLVPIWGSPVSGGKVTVEEAKTYTTFLVERFGDKPNIIWLNGGDVQGDKGMDVWQTIGNTLDSLDGNHLITFHPRGRRMSSEWFHNESWLDFNMFQSGHRNYDQDTASDSHRFGPDNWKYVEREYAMKPVKPTLDGEPSYEEIPYGLHDENLDRWTDADLRRYAYWSVFAGAAGFTYGHNSVMQFYVKGEEERAFGALASWQEALDFPGAGQMQYLKDLILSKSYFDRVPNQGLVANQGERYDYVTATSGKDYALLYTFTGRDIEVNMGQIEGEQLKTSWFDPRTGETMDSGVVENQGVQSFDPPGEPNDGNDWVLVLESVK